MRTNTGRDEFGARVRAYRRARKLTLRDVADAAGISVTYLSDLERGVLRNPSLEKVASIAHALGVTANDLLGPHPDDRAAALPKALREFRESILFHGAIEREAALTGRSSAELDAEWMRILSAIHLGSRRPRDRSDYQFLFEAIRRALGDFQ